MPRYWLIIYETAYQQTSKEVPRTRKKWYKIQKDSKNLKKLKIFKNWSLKKHPITSRIYAVTYNYTLDDVLWPLSLEKPKKMTNIQET